MVDAQSAGASRFFYVAKASRSERNVGVANNHPTVKPLKLMEYLCRLVSYPTGTLLLDPFVGSGTTAIACERVGLNWVAIERDPHNCEIAAARIKAAEQF